MPKDNQDVSEVPKKGHHIFNAPKVEPMAKRWKELKALGRETEADAILDDLVTEFNDMFSRMARYEQYDKNVELASLVNAASAKLPIWLNAWDPAKGSLFTWSSKCAKYLFLGEVVRQSTYTKRNQAIGDDLEKYHGHEDHAIVAEEANEVVKSLVSGVHSRWSNKRINECIKFHVAAIVECPGVTKKTIIRSGAFASGMTLEQSRFYYNWALYALREATYQRITASYTEQDLVLLATQDTYVKELLGIVSWKQLLAIVSIFGGTRLKIPTLQQLDAARSKARLFVDVDRTDMLPGTVAKMAKAASFSIAAADEALEGMAMSHSDEGDEPLW